MERIHRDILVEKEQAVYMRKCKFVFFIIALACVLLASACSSPYDKITEEDEKTILFIITTYHWNSDTVDIQAIDNTGMIYATSTTGKVLPLIENGEIFDCEIVGANEEMLEYYELLRKIGTEVDSVYEEHQNYPEAPDIYYYGILYDDEEMEYVELLYEGGAKRVLDADKAEEIITWMETWDWREYTGIYW